MNREDLKTVKAWFDEYCASCAMPAREDQRNIATKQEHTHRVCLNAVEIAADLGLAAQETLLAETAALCHDIGRFPQYQQYRTFDDAVSVNHAALSVRVLLEHKVLRDLSRREQDLITRAVALHNVFILPDTLDDETLLFARLLRDADKLDILRVVILYLGQDADSRAEAVALGLPDLPGYSPSVLSSLSRGEMARKDELKTLNDFKLLQLAWLYDLNFTHSFRMILERDYISSLARTLPENDEISRAIGIVRGYAERKARGA